MKKALIPILIIVVVGIFIYTKAVGTYNQFVQTEEVINGQWAEVETQYQRRADLIPNLVNTVKGYADFDQENLTPENIAAFQQAQDEVSGYLSRLLVTVEKYPDLKANHGFLDLQAQLEGT